MSLASCLGPVADGLAVCFSGYGRWASSSWRPAVLLVTTIAFAGAMAAGITLQQISSEASEIFTPISSPARVDDARFDAIFPSSNVSDSLEFLLRLPSGGNVWSSAAINTLENVWQQTLQLPVTLKTGKVISLADICDEGPFSGCDRVTASDCLSNADRSALVSGTAASGASTAAPPIPLLSLDTRVCSRTADGAFGFVPQSTGTDVTAAAVAPPPAAYPWSGAEITASSSLGISFTIVSGAGMSPAEPTMTKNEVAIEYLTAWIVKATEMQTNIESEGWLAAFATSESTEFALEESTGGDIVLVILAIVLLVTFAIISGASSDCVRSRHAVAVGGVAAVALAIPASFGLMAYAQVPYVATIGTTPFLVLAVGVDSTFVILSAFNRRSVSESVSERIGHALYEAGPAITLTTVTDVLAFVIGGVTSPFRAVNYFCLYTGCAIALAFIFVLTAFVPLMALDGAREVAGRSALTFCAVEGRGGAAESAVSSKTIPTAGEAELASKSSGVTGSEVGRAKTTDGLVDARSSSGAVKGAAAASPSSSSSVPSTSSAADGAADADEDYQGKACDLFMGNVLAPAITSPVGLVITVILWLGLLGASGYGVTQIQEGLALSELAVDGHHLVRYDEWNVAYYSLGFPYSVFTDEHDPIDLANGPLREALRRLPKEINTIESTIISSPDSIFDELASALGANSTDTLAPADFDAVLLQLLSDPAIQAQYDQTLVFTRVSGTTSTDIPFEAGFGGAVDALTQGDRVLIRHALYSLRTKSLPLSTERADSMEATRAAATKAVSRLEPTAGSLGKATVQFEAFIFFEADVVLAPATIVSLALGIAAIAVVALVLLPHLAAVIIVVIAVASIDLILLASMPVFGTNLNTVSGINLLLSIGLSVDAVAHVSHAFLHSTEPLRAAKKMVKWKLMTDDYPAVCCGCVGGAERRRRAVAAVLTMARPVLQGTGSSMLGLIVLAFSTSSIFRIFFQILFTTIVLSLAHALLLVPVLLALVGPLEHHYDAHDAAALEDKHAASGTPGGEPAGAAVAASPDAHAQRKATGPV